MILPPDAIDSPMEDFSKELGIVEKYLLRGEYPVGMTKADKKKKSKSEKKMPHAITSRQKMLKSFVLSKKCGNR